MGCGWCVYCVWMADYLSALGAAVFGPRLSGGDPSVKHCSNLHFSIFSSLFRLIISIFYYTGTPFFSVSINLKGSVRKLLPLISMILCCTFQTTIHYPYAYEIAFLWCCRLENLTVEAPGSNPGTSKFYISITIGTWQIFVWIARRHPVLTKTNNLQKYAVNMYLKLSYLLVPSKLLSSHFPLDFTVFYQFYLKIQTTHLNCL